MKARAHTLFEQTLLGDAAEHAEIGIRVWNEERRYVAVNTFACRMLGVSREELLGSQVGDQNPTAAARDAIEASLEELPAFGRTPLPNGVIGRLDHGRERRRGAAAHRRPDVGRDRRTSEN